MSPGTPRPTPRRPPAAAACRVSLTLTAHGARIAVWATDRDALARLRPRFPPGWRLSRPSPAARTYTFVPPKGRRVGTLHAGITRIARSRRLDALLDAFESDLHHHVAEWAPRRVFLHAGVVGWRGRAIVLPGHSMSGKTSLVAALIRAGAVYYSDEYAVLDAQGRAHPFPRSLAVRAADGRRDRLAPETLGARVGRRPLPVGLVVVSRYRTGARWRPRALSAGEGALALLANAVAIRRAPARVLAAVQAAVAWATILRGVRGEARDTAAALLTRLGRPAPATPRAASLPR